MFLGTYEPKLDDKGRVILPAKFREQLADGLVMTPGQERCLYVFPSGQFEQIFQDLLAAPTTSKNARDYVRVLMSRGTNETPDRQGRVTIPGTLRGYANLDRDLVVIGAGNRAEIWDANAWATYLAEQEDKFADIAEEIVPGMF